MIQTYQAWQDHAFLHKLIKLNKHPLLHGHGYSIIFLQRLNFIANYMATDNANTAGNGKELIALPVKIDLTKANKERNVIDEIFKTGLDTLKKEFPWLYVSYERMNRDHTVFLTIFKHLGLDNVQLFLDSCCNNHGTSVFTVIADHFHYNITVSNSTKHHKVLPYEYISNLDEVAGRLRYYYIIDQL